MKKILILICISALWPAPVFSEGRPPAVIRQRVNALNRSVANNQRRSYLAANPDCDPEIVACINRGQTRLGMSWEQVCASIGNPVARKELSDSRSKWTYSDGTMLFFRNGQLVGRKDP